MRKIWVGLCLSLALVGGARAQTPQPPPSKGPDEGARRCATLASNSIEQFGRGDEFSRAGIVEQIATLRDRPGVQIADLRPHLDQLARCYDARSGREQTWLDGGASLVLFGSSGAALSAGAGAMTQGYWGAAGLAPGIISQFNAWEPTRDLYQAGGEALDFLSQRYWQLNRATSALQLKGPTKEAAKCGANLPKLDQELAQWSETDRAVIGPEIERLQRLCNSLDLERGRLDRFLAAAVVQQNWIGPGLANDVLQLDRQIKIQDRSLRYTPLQAVSMIAASPFLTVGSILSNEDSKGAVEALKTQKAVSTLQVPVSSLDLPAAPSVLALPEPLSDAARQRTDVPRAGRSRPDRKQARDLLEQLAQIHLDLAKGINEHNERAQVAVRIAELSRPGVIKARFDPETHAIALTFTPADGS